MSPNKNIATHKSPVRQGTNNDMTAKEETTTKEAGSEETFEKPD